MLSRDVFCLFRLEFALLGDVILQLADGDPHLLHGVAVPDGDAVVGGGVLVAHGLEVHSDAQGGADLVFPAVALADGTGVVKVHHEVLAQLPINLLGLGAELLGQGQNGRLVGRQRRMQAQNHAHILLALGVGQMLFIISFSGIFEIRNDISIKTQLMSSPRKLSAQKSETMKTAVIIILNLGSSR